MNTHIVALRALNFTYYATTALLLPFLPLFFRNQGFDSSQIGMLMMIGPFVSIFSQPVWGYVSDRLQTVKWVVLTLWVLTISSSVGLFLSRGYEWNLLFSLLLYFFMLPSVPLLDSLSIRVAEQYGRTYASIRAFGSAGFASIALISGFVVPFIGGVDGIKYMYWLLWLFPVPLLVFFVHDQPSKGPKIRFRAIGEVLKNKKFLWFMLIMFVLAIPHRANDGLFALYASGNGAPNWMVSLGWAVAAMCEAPGMLFAARLIRRFHELAFLGFVALFYALRWFLYASIHVPIVLVLMQAFHFVSFAPFWIISIHYVTRLVPDGYRATGQSIAASVFQGLAGIVGGYGGGMLVERWGGTGLYASGTTLAIAAALLLFATRIYERRNEI